MRGHEFLTQAIGNPGVEALEKTATLLPELESVILPRVIMAWLHTASELGYEGPIPGTQAVMKSDAVCFGGSQAGVKADFIGAASLVCLAAGCNDLDVPSTLKPALVANLAKTVDLLTKTRFLKRVRELEKTATDEGSQTSDASTDDPLKKGTELPGKAAEPRGPQAPTAPVPQTKQQGQQPQQPKAPVGTSGNKKPLTPT